MWFIGKQKQQNQESEPYHTKKPILDEKIKKRFKQINPSISRSNANPNTQDDQSRTEEGETDAHLFAKDHRRDGCGGERGGVGHRHGDGDGGAAQHVEESGGGGQVDQERDGVLPRQEEVDPPEDVAEEAAPGAVARRARSKLELPVPDESPAAHDGVGSTPHDPYGDHLLHVPGHIFPPLLPPPPPTSFDNRSNDPDRLLWLILIPWSWLTSLRDS